ncbi:hypothetical protein E3P92_03919 [Wallemia ichthyophaga]|uniref:Major facilitator superfamily (MFS) profile domain-containing protein n=1 Tax=Wallemia ichthyophaga TaxID=245174 RepID=A0A4V6TMW9_WALIC|nr:hypothetical protein E3P93_03900 [Wallemia ichthyophaga]TIB07804.1 hypothetical protein E3P90_03903 [Wallemia ichthyophaga]TIB07922.1 hypothetical protein E3P92_03919 [Wallemia ichthyophaga]TIB19517.1 hypothetical protein E3P89_03890 [Wallemia ichthyophaga]TIB20521.1 hypothetical protein E3P88_03890 [Wallemia ichthyophaga]
MSKDEHSESGESSELARSEEVHVLPKNNLWLCLPALLLVTFLGSLDSTIVSVSLNTISKDLNSSSQSAYSWVGTIYLLTCTVVGPVTGKMTDIMGMKPMLYSGIALFVLSSGLCGASVSMKQLIAFRGLQGLGRGMMRVSTQIIISNIITLQNRGLVNSLVGLVHSLSNAIGPLIGGAIAEHTSWSWCFWINLPTSAIAFTMLFFFLNVSQPPHASFKEKFNSFDYLGLILIVGGAVCVLLGFSLASSLSWQHAATISLLIIGWLLLITFGIWEIKAEKKGVSVMVPPRLFKSITPTAILIGCAAHSLAFYISGFYLPLYFQYAKMSTPTFAGLHVIPFAFGSSFASILYGYLLAKFKRYRPIIWFCWIFFLVGNALVINLDAKSSLAKQIVYLLVMAVGNGGLFSTPLTALQACMTLKQTNTSTSSFTFVRDLAGTMGISLGGVIMHTEAVKRLSKIDGGQRFADMSEIASLKEADISENLRMSVQQAYSKAISTNYIFTSCVIAVGFLASLSIKKYTLDVKNIKEGEEEEDGEEKGDGNKKGFRKEEDEGKGEIHLPATTASSDTTLVKTKDMENQKPKQHL